MTPVAASSSVFSEEEFEEEEEVVVEPATSPRRTRTRQTRQKRVKPVPEKPLPKPREQRPVNRDPPPRTVTFQSTLTFSSDEDEKVEKVTRSPPKSVGSRTELSETRFRKRINDIGKERVVSSTSFSDSSATTTTTTKVRRLEFDRSFPKRSVRKEEVRVYNKPSSVVEENTVEEEEDDIVEEEEDDIVEEEEEIVEEEGPLEAPDSLEKHTVIEEETWISEEDSDEQSARRYIPRASLYDIGWKECTLALFIMGLGAVGYICHTTDICNLC